MEVCPYPLNLLMHSAFLLLFQQLILYVFNFKDNCKPVLLQFDHLLNYASTSSSGFLFHPRISGNDKAPALDLLVYYTIPGLFRKSSKPMQILPVASTLSYKELGDMVANLLYLRSSYFLILRIGVCFHRSF